MKNYSVILLRISALFGLIGAVLGGHMAGSGDFQFRPIHAHILVVGWLSLFSWAVFYKVFYKKTSLLATFHTWSAIIGTFGLVIGMWLQFLNPFNTPEILTLIVYIGGGSILLLSYVLFFILTFLYNEEKFNNLKN